MTRAGRRSGTLVVAAAVLLALGFGVRRAEDNQVGSTDTASRGLFIASGLCAYFAGYVAVRGRGRRTRRATERTASHDT